jgi:hypothetical protein
MPSLTDNPWPREPVEASRPGSLVTSGWPCSRELPLSNVFSSSIGRKPRSAITVYTYTKYIRKFPPCFRAVQTPRRPREMTLCPCRGRAEVKGTRDRVSRPGQIHSAINSLRVELQAKGTSTGRQLRSAELWIAASTKASPLTPSSTVGKARSISSGGSCRILATTALAKSE